MNASRTAWVSLLLLTAGCLHTIEECRGVHCPRDGGATASDAGHDAGESEFDAGTPYPLTCATWDGGNIGTCAGHTGYVFDGTGCHGECVLYPIETPGVFPSLRACAFGCAADHCDTALFSATHAFDETTFCNALRVTTVASQQIIDTFALDVSQVDGGVGCNATDCVLLTGQTLGDGGYTEACAASLMPETTLVSCD